MRYRDSATSSASTAEWLPSLFEGFEAAIGDQLSVRSLRHRSALLELMRREEPVGIPGGSIAAAFEILRANWHRAQAEGRGSVSCENWRWRVPQLAIGADNKSPEVVLERAIAAACERAGRVDWSNQIPVASGVVRASSERRRAIDLVRQCGEGHFEFIELKVGSDTPLYAAFEIIGYVLVWLLSREPRGETASALLAAERIDACVLAPARYYAGYSLRALERRLDAELRALGEAAGVVLGFRFEALPDQLVPQPAYDDAAIVTLLDARQPL